MGDYLLGFVVNFFSFVGVHLMPGIFDKFVKAQRDSEPDGGQGTGLGLAIAKGIMEAHGGTIAAESPVASGRGTRMTLSFARKEPA